VPVDPVEIAKHGFGIALAHHLQNNMSDELRLNKSQLSVYCVNNE